MADDPHSVATEWRDLRDALRELHRRLLAAVQKSFEKMHGRVAGPGELLQIAANDPLFTWLKPLTAELAALEALDEPPDPRAVDAARAALARLLETASDFRAAYLVYLQSDPEVVVAHGALRERVLKTRRP